MSKPTIIFISIIILISFAVGTYFYPQMPDLMASHWDISGEVDSHLNKFWGLFLMPIISVGVLLMFIIIPKIDPLKKNIKQFKHYFDWFIILLVLFLFYIYMLSILWNLNYQFNMTQMMTPALGILFYYIGILTEHSKQNWFIGIKTPWTLSSKIVWDKTHHLGGRLFKLVGVISFLGLLVPQYAIFFLLIPAVSFSIYLVFYSYFEYQKVQS